LLNPIRKRSATAARLTVVLLAGWTALVVARPRAAASPAAEAPNAQQAGREQPGSTVSTAGSAGVESTVAGASASSRATTFSGEAAFSRRIAGHADHAVVHATINFSALARDEARGMFMPARRHRGVRPQANPFVASRALVDVSRVQGKKPAILTAVRNLAEETLNGFAGLGDNNTVIPPDADGAVGPDHLVLALNSQIEIQTRAGTPISTVSTLSFWSSLGVGSITDPRVIYDPYGQRWIVITAGDPQTSGSAVLIGVSQNSNPTAGWNLYRVPVDSTGQLWGNFPIVGFNKNWIVVGINLFTIQGTFFEYENIYAFDKANLYAGGSGLFTLLQDDTGGFSMNPALTYDPNLATLYLLESWSSASGLLRMSTITGAVGSEVLTTGVALPTSPQPWQAVEPTLNFAPQLGSTKDIDMDDDRLDWTVYRT
jgi:hypothetical protein